MRVDYSPSRAQLAADTSKLEADTARWKTFRIENREEAEQAAAEREASRVLLKGLTDLQRRVGAPLQKELRTISALILPARKTLQDRVDYLSSEIGRYAIECAEAQRAQYEAVADNLDELEPEELTEALDNAQDAGVPKLAGTAIGLYWAVDRIARDLLLPEYWCPDMAKIEAAADEQGRTGADPPVIPGVVFKLVADVRATGRR